MANPFPPPEPQSPSSIQKTSSFTEHSASSLSNPHNNRQICSSSHHTQNAQANKDDRLPSAFPGTALSGMAQLVSSLTPSLSFSSPTLPSAPPEPSDGDSFYRSGYAPHPKEFLPSKAHTLQCRKHSAMTVGRLPPSPSTPSSLLHSFSSGSSLCVHCCKSTSLTAKSKNNNY